VKFLTWQNPEQLIVAQEFIKIFKILSCGIKGNLLSSAFSNLTKPVLIYHKMHSIKEVLKIFFHTISYFIPYILLTANSLTALPPMAPPTPR
jgi:hypothetical protein